MDIGSIPDWLALIFSVFMGVLSVYLNWDKLQNLPLSQIKKAVIRLSLGLFIALVVWGIFQLGKWSSESTEIEVTRITEVAVPVTVEIEATREVTRIVQQEVELPVTRIVSVEVTKLVEIPIENASPNSSENQESTSIPIPTPSPPPTSSSLVTEFYDDFSNGISEEYWEFVNGRDNFSIVDGQLVASGDLEISIGDESWTDYVVEVNIASALTNVTRGNYVAVRRTDTSMIAVAFAGSGDSRIHSFQNGSWEFVPNSIFVNPRGEKTLRIEVEGRNLSVFYNGIFVKSILIDNVSGKVSLKIGNSTTINWFRIAPIQ